MDKPTVVQTHSGTLLSSQKERTTNSHNTNDPQMHSDSKGHILYDPTNMTENRPAVAGVLGEGEKGAARGMVKCRSKTALYFDHGSDHMTICICLNSENNIPKKVSSTLFKF